MLILDEKVHLAFKMKAEKRLLSLLLVPTSPEKSTPLGESGKRYFGQFRASSAAELDHYAAEIRDFCQMAHDYQATADIDAPAIAVKITAARTSGIWHSEAHREVVLPVKMDEPFKVDEPFLKRLHAKIISTIMDARSSIEKKGNENED